MNTLIYSEVSPTKQRTNAFNDEGAEKKSGTRKMIGIQTNTV